MRSTSECVPLTPTPVCTQGAITAARKPRRSTLRLRDQALSVARTRHVLTVCSAYTTSIYGCSACTSTYNSTYTYRHARTVVHTRETLINSAYTQSTYHSAYTKGLPKWNKENENPSYENALTAAPPLIFRAKPTGPCPHIAMPCVVTWSAFSHHDLAFHQKHGKGEIIAPPTDRRIPPRPCLASGQRGCSSPNNQEASGVAKG